MKQLVFHHGGGIVYLRQEEGRVMYPVEGGGEEVAPCMWFALCERPAVTTEEHFLLGAVPICERCLKKVGPQ